MMARSLSNLIVCFQVRTSRADRAAIGQFKARIGHVAQDERARAVLGRQVRARLGAILAVLASAADAHRVVRDLRIAPVRPVLAETRHAMVGTDQVVAVQEALERCERFGLVLRQSRNGSLA